MEGVTYTAAPWMQHSNAPASSREADVGGSMREAKVEPGTTLH